MKEIIRSRLKDLSSVWSVDDWKKNCAQLLEETDRQNERIEQLEKALNEITELGWSERFCGGYQYMGEYHAEAIKIARQALGKEE